MRRLLALVVASVCLPVFAQEDQTQRAVQRALIQLDQRSAEFAAQLRGQDVRELQNLHAIQLRDAGRLAPELMPYERMRMADERELRLPPPVRYSPDAGFRAPLPLPGGPQHVVDPVTAPSVGG